LVVCTATAENLRHYQLHLVDNSISSISLNAMITAPFAHPVPLYNGILTSLHV